MSFTVRTEDVDRVCSLFPGDSVEISDLCNWMRGEFSVVDGEIQVVDGFEITSPSTALAVGTRQVFRAYVNHLLPEGFDHPLKDLAKTRALEYILQLEDAEFPSQLFEFRNAFGRAFDGIVEQREVKFGKNIIRNPELNKRLFDEYMENLILGQNTSLPMNSKPTKRQGELLQSIWPGAPNWSELDTFEDFWNDEVSERIFKRLERQVASALKDDVRTFLQGIQFHLINDHDIFKVIDFLHSEVPKAMARGMREKFVKADDPGFRKLTSAGSQGASSDCSRTPRRAAEQPQGGE